MCPCRQTSSSIWHFGKCVYSLRVSGIALNYHVCQKHTVELTAWFSGTVCLLQCFWLTNALTFLTTLHLPQVKVEPDLTFFASTPTRPHCLEIVFVLFVFQPLLSEYRKFILDLRIPCRVVWRDRDGGVGRSGWRGLHVTRFTSVSCNSADIFPCA